MLSPALSPPALSMTRQYVVDLDVTDRFTFDSEFVEHINQMPYRFGFGGVGAAVYYRTYANPLSSGGTEHWPDTILRSITGALTILKWHMLRNRLPWDEHYWQGYAMKMAEAAHQMRWLPPGRGLQHNGKELIYERGAAFLQNCAGTSIKKLSSDAYWVADMALCGVGIGFSTYDYKDRLQIPAESSRIFVVPDTREGWAESIKVLIESYEQGSETIEFDYSLVRPEGSPIHAIGGVSAGPQPLITAHERMRRVLTQYAKNEISPTRVVTDIINIIGVAVVSGGQRRTALIALGSPEDREFAQLKDYGTRNRAGDWLTIGPAHDRQEWSWASNNSIVLNSHEDFRYLPDIADAIRNNGEPGVLNMINIQKYGRMGEEMVDHASLINPCGEQPLEDKEVCCLSEVYYTNCKSEQEFYEAIEYATMYASMVTLLPTHDPQTNAKIMKNRRIGVSISGVAEAIQKEHSSSLIRKLRRAYRLARNVNNNHAIRCGVPASVRVSTSKPSGSTSLVAGTSAGLHYPAYGRYIRRMRVQNQSPIVQRLSEAGIPHEPDDYDMNSTVFEFPVNLGPIRGQRDVSMWAKAAVAQMIQAHWADNATSVTVTFDKKKEGNQIEDLLAFAMPTLKSISMLPELDMDDDEMTYTQLPYEEITLKEYEERFSKISPIDWRNFEQESVELERFCDGDSCTW